MSESAAVGRAGTAEQQGRCRARTAIVTVRPLNIQLWSFYFAPEPMGIAPISAEWASEMRARGHRVEVVTAHPTYPRPVWGRRMWPYRENRDDIPVLRLPVRIGRSNARDRLLGEASYTAGLALASPTLGTPDVIVASSPSFPALLPTLLNARARRVPWNTLASGHSSGSRRRHRSRRGGLAVGQSGEDAGEGGVLIRRPHRGPV